MTVDADTPAPALECSSFGVMIAGRPIIGRIDLALTPGRAVAMLGLSGAGKSTFARALVGLEPSLSGSMIFAGQQLVGAAPKAWAHLRRRVQLCWQDPLQALDPRLSALRSINSARSLAGLSPWDPDDAKLRRLADDLGIAADVLLRRPAAISGGQRQRVALARALACQPALLLADEITSALDRPLAFDIIGRLKARVRGGLGLLLITHDLSLLPGWIDEVCVLDRGELVERGTPEQLLEQPQHPLTRRLRDALPRLPAGVYGASP